MLTCDENCLHFNLAGSSNAQAGAQRVIDSAPLVNGGGSFNINFRVYVYWISTGSTVASPAGSSGVHILATVAGTPITFATTAYNSAYTSATWHPYQYQGFIPESFSSSTATITLGFDAQVPTGDGHYSIWVDRFSVTVPTSSSPVQSTNIASPGTTSSPTGSNLSINADSVTMSNGTLVTNPGSATQTGAAFETSNSNASRSLSTSNTLSVFNAGIGESNGTTSGGPSAGLIGGVVTAAVVTALGLILLFWLTKRRQRQRKRAGSTTVVNPYEDTDVAHAFTLANHYHHSPSATTQASESYMLHQLMETTGQDQLRQWGTASPTTEVLPAYRTSLGSAIPGPVDESEYEGAGEPQPRRVGLVLHSAIPEESSEGTVSSGDIKAPRGTIQRDIKH